jgi:hypothetical protein
VAIFDNPGIMSGNIWQSWHYEGNLLVIGLVTVEEVKLCIIDLDAGGGAGSLSKSGWTANICNITFCKNKERKNVYLISYNGYFSQQTHSSLFGAFI